MALQRGSSGPAVKEWQKTLNRVKKLPGGNAVFTLAQGLYLPAGVLADYGLNPDGRFGVQTDAVTKAVQDVLKLTPDGKVGPLTMTSVKAKWPSAVVTMVTLSEPSKKFTAPVTAMPQPQTVVDVPEPTPAQASDDKTMKMLMIGAALLAVIFILKKKKG